jgi:hypothetical protein
MLALHLGHEISNARLGVTIKSLEIVLTPRHFGHSILIVIFLNAILEHWPFGVLDVSNFPISPSAKKYCISPIYLLDAFPVFRFNRANLFLDEYPILNIIKQLTDEIK